ncbi:MAG: hypothetical protein DRH24_15235, partial [Deltaproteobacteria bacterium]
LVDVLNCLIFFTPLLCKENQEAVRKWLCPAISVPFLTLQKISHFRTASYDKINSTCNISSQDHFLPNFNSVH